MEDNIKVYENDIFLYADEFIETILCNDISHIKDNFRYMLSYISDRISIDIELFDDLNKILKLFDVYLKLCDKYNYNPSLGMFLSLCKMKRKDINSRLNNNDKLILYNSIQEQCKDRIIDDISNNKGSDRNKLFAASAVYGLSEIAPSKQSVDNLTTKSNAELLDNLKNTLPL